MTGIHAPGHLINHINDVRCWKESREISSVLPLDISPLGVLWGTFKDIGIDNKQTFDINPTEDSNEAAGFQTSDLLPVGPQMRLC